MEQGIKSLSNSNSSNVITTYYENGKYLNYIPISSYHFKEENY